MTLTAWKGPALLGWIIAGLLLVTTAVAVFSLDRAYKQVDRALTNNSDALSLQQAASAQLSSEVAALGLKVDTLASDVEELPARLEQLNRKLDDQTVSTRMALSSLTAELGSGQAGGLPVFPSNATRSKALQMLEDCISERLATLLGGMGNLYAQTSAWAKELEAFTGAVVGFSEGELTTMQEAASMGAFFGCWTLTPAQSTN